ncbi:MAG TPA: YqiA/YcfP family alpha/beta fold hydrolase [Bryobacteraceae bacterium]|nr:YqiA/YcfP family alpha/beta fold hydrolase [Bryobacteraceae bacterium]
MNRIIYLHGFASGPASGKARYFQRKFADRGVSIEIPDLSEGCFENLTISGQLRVIERAARGESVALIGSSLGGYLAALYAARHPEVEKLVLLAPAFYFSSRWADTFGAERLAQWQRDGALPFFHYSDCTMRNLKYHFIEDAITYDPEPNFCQPTLVYHGTQDDVVPACYSKEFAASHANVQLHLVDSGHDLHNVQDKMWEGVAAFLL